MNKREITVKHADGRAVHALILGSPECGRVVVYHHGFPACRLEALLARQYVSDLGICIISIDRPGMGYSDWYPDRRLEDWPNDITLILDSIGVEKFAILAVSGGTPSGVVAAAALPLRALSLTIVSGIAPMHLPEAMAGMNVVNRNVVRITHGNARLGRAVIYGVASAWKMAPKIAELWFGALLPRQDLELVRQPLVAGVLGRTMHEALHRGVRGVVSDYGLLSSRWDTHLAAIRVPTTVWHGTADTYVPFGMGRILHEQVSGSNFRVIEGGGHFMMVERLPEVLKQIVEQTWGYGDA